MTRQERRSRAPNQDKVRGHGIPGGDYDQLLLPSFTFNGQPVPVTMYKFRDGQNHIRIFPITPGMPVEVDDWAQGCHVHYGIGPDKEAYYCPAKHQNGQCKPCDERNALRAQAEVLVHDPARAEQLRKMASDAGWTKRYLVWILDRMDEAKGPQVMICGQQLMTGIIGILSDPQTGADIDLTDEYQGHDLFFTKTGQKFQTAYSGCQLARQPTPLHQDPQWISYWFGMLDSASLESLMQHFPAEHIAMKFGGGLADGPVPMQPPGMPPMVPSPGMPPPMAPVGPGYHQTPGMYPPTQPAPAYAAPGSYPDVPQPGRDDQGALMDEPVPVAAEIPRSAPPTALPPQGPMIAPPPLGTPPPLRETLSEVPHAAVPYVPQPTAVPVAPAAPPPMANPQPAAPPPQYAPAPPVPAAPQAPPPVTLPTAAIPGPAPVIPPQVYVGTTLPPTAAGAPVPGVAPYPGTAPVVPPVHPSQVHAPPDRVPRRVELDPT